MPYTIRTSARARYVRLSILPDGTIVVTTPVRFREESVARFVKRHDAWIRRNVERAKLRRVVRLNRAEIPRLKRAARALAEELCARYATRYGFSYRKITIRAQKSRWGSCSRSGNLSFNYRIAALPKALAEYIAVHEVCHLGELNHSPAFWRLVAREIPDFRDRRKALRSLAFIYC
jgi:predicted metal-dependent hydrolase